MMALPSVRRASVAARRTGSPSMQPTRLSRAALAPAAAVAILVALALPTSPARVAPIAPGAEAAPASSPYRQGAAKVSAEVLAQAAAGEPVRVNIALAATLPRAPSRADVRARVAAVQSRVLGRLSAPGFALVYRHAGIPGMTAVVSPAVLQLLERDPDIAAVTLDQAGAGAGIVAPVRGGTTAGDAAPLSHSVPMIGADQVHAMGITGAGVTVAILDSGADLDHPDLADSIVGQECFLSGPGSRCPNRSTRQSGSGAAQDDLGHGTNVAGIITSNGVVSAPGVAPGASVVLYKVLNSSNSGQFSDWDAALSDIIANHPEVRVVNMSLISFTTFTGDCSSFDPNTASAFSILNGMGVSIFVSSGNNGVKNRMTYPSCIPGAVSVGAVYDQDFASSSFFGCTDTPAPMDTPTCWSNSRSDLALLAPGSFIVSDGLGGGTSTYTGTSQAAPHASGVAALMLEDAPALTRDALEARMETTGVPRTDPENGVTTPRVDALAAMQSVAPVGGVATLPDVASLATRDARAPAGCLAAAAAAAGVALALAAAYAWRRRRSARWS